MFRARWRPRKCAWAGLGLLAVLASGCAASTTDEVADGDADLFGRNKTTYSSVVRAGIYRVVDVADQRPRQFTFEKVDDSACLFWNAKSGGYSRRIGHVMMRLARGWTMGPEGDAPFTAFGQVCVGRDQRLYFVGRQYLMPPEVSIRDLGAPWLPQRASEMLTGPQRMFVVGRLRDASAGALADGREISQQEIVMADGIKLEIHHVTDWFARVPYGGADKSAELELRSKVSIEEVPPTTELALVSSP